jgi:hypothetical protein
VQDTNLPYHNSTNGLRVAVCAHELLESLQLATQWLPPPPLLPCTLATRSDPPHTHTHPACVFSACLCLCLCRMMP